MFHWKIIIILAIIQIIFNIYNYKQTDTPKENNCINSSIINLTLLWIKFSITLIDYSKSIIKNNANIVLMHNKTIEMRDKLFETFNKIYHNTQNFEKIINNQIIIKTNLCISINMDNKDKIKEYTEKLTENNKKLINFFSTIKNNKANNDELTKTINNHNELYIKSMSNIKKIDNDELQRELVIGSIDTAKILFI